MNGRPTTWLCSFVFAGASLYFDPRSRRWAGYGRPLCSLKILSHMAYDLLRNNLKRHLGFQPVEHPVSFQILDEQLETSYTRLLILYSGDENDTIPAYLLVPHGAGPFPATLIFHQHNSQWHLGKSEVCGLAGSPWQAFGPALAREGFVVLRPGFDLLRRSPQQPTRHRTRC